jgi:DNA-binding winged helix-turn-helix (wHTH) protein/tetratricopeptide (TPR) repeat protein
MRYLFGDCVLDVQRYELLRAGRIVPLRPKVFQVLLYLIEQRDRVVSKEELFEHVWPEQFVGDASLNSIIMELRKALGDQARDARFIRTRRGRGYHFVAEVSQVAEATPSSTANEAEAAPATLAAHVGGSNVPSTATPAAAPRPAEDSEHKVGTVLSCALEGTSVADGHTAAEDLHHLTQTLYQRAEAVVRRYDGMLFSVTSDGLTALFGAPQAHEDHARRAVLAALDLLASRFDTSDTAPQLQLRGGLYSGPMVSGYLETGAERRYTVAGPALHAAAAVQRLAAPGQVLMGDTTYRLVQQEFFLEAVSLPRDVESALGFAVHAVRGVRQRLAGVGGDPSRRRSAFVGRQQELDILRERLAYAHNGNGQLVSLVGEPGMGKSRLLYEFIQPLRSQPLICHIADCLPYGRHIPYVPVRDVFRQRCGLTPTAGHTQVETQIRQYLHDHGLADDLAVQLLSSFLDLPGPTAAVDRLTPEARRLQTFTLLSELLRRASRQQPLVLAIENLHWIDATSEAWLLSLIPQLSTMAVLLVLTYRPEYAPAWGDTAPGTRLLFPPLLPQDSLQMVQAIPEATPLPDAVAQALVARAGGNPFFLEELARSFGGADIHAAALTIPETVQSVLAARIDRLPAAEKWLLRTASVCVADFTPSLLREVARVDDTLLRSLLVLQAADLLEATTAFPEPRYRFRHALVQEVAYGSLLAPRRQALHTDVGRTLETLYADRLDEIVDQLGYHYARSSDSHKAITYLMRAATKAAQNYAHLEAVASLEEAERQVERAGTDARRRWRLDILLRQAFSLSCLGRFQDILERLSPLQGDIDQVDDADLVSAYHFRVGMTQTYLGQYGEAKAHAARALDAAQRGQDPAMLGMVHHLLAFVSFSSNQPRQGAHHGQRAVAQLEPYEASHRHWLGLAHWAVGVSASYLGEFDLALQALGRAHRIGAAAGDPRLQSLADAVTGWIQVLVGQVQDGLWHARRALERAPDPVSMAVAHLYLGIAYLENGQPDTAIPLLQQALQGFERFRLWQGVGRSAAWLGQAWLEVGEAMAARQQAQAAWRVSKQIGYVYGLALTQRLLGYLALHRQRSILAASYFEAARRLFEAMEARHELARTHLALAILAQQQGQVETLVEHLRHAQRGFTASRVPGDLAHTEALARAAGVHHRIVGCL